MTMTDERLAELDAVMAMLGKAPLWKTGQWFERNAADIRAHIDAQAATIARMREALQVIVDDYQASPEHHPNDILIPIASFGLACAALTGAAS